MNRQMPGLSIFKEPLHWDFSYKHRSTLTECTFIVLTAKFQYLNPGFLVSDITDISEKSTVDD